MSNEKRLIYAIRDTESGELVSNITTKHTTYYKRYAYAENVVRKYRKRKAKPKHGELEIVQFALTEVASYAVD